MRLTLNQEDVKAQSPAQHHVYDSEIEDEFNTVLELAVQVCSTSAAAIAVATNGRISFRYFTGFLEKEYLSIPYHVNGAPISCESLKKDFLSFTTQDLNSNSFHFFTCLQIAEDENEPVFLCVMNHEPFALTEKQLIGFRLIAKQASSTIKLKSQNFTLKQNLDNSFSNNEGMNTIFHNAINAVIVVDIKGNILQWNPKAETIFGWTASEVISKPLHETILPKRFHEKHLNLMDEFKLNSDDHEFKSTVEIGAIRKDCSEFYIDLGISPFSNNENQYYICFINDITDRKMVAQKLDKQKKFYENILNKLPTDIAVFDADHKYLFVNPGAISVKEYRKYIIGRDDFEYAEYRNRDSKTAHLRRAQFLQVKNTGKEIRWEDNLKNPNGKTITHLRSLLPVHDEDGNLTMVIGFGLDITDRKIMEEKQKSMVLKLSEQNVQLIDFCNIVSHNLRGPLVNMSLLVQYIEEAIEPADQHLLISKLKPVIENLSLTFNELVESIQIKQDLEIKSEDNSLNKCLEKTLDGLKAEIVKLGAVIEADFDEVSTVFFPSKYLNNILHNLLSNSLKYHSPARKPIIKLKTKKLDGSVLFSVNDNGLGVDLYKHRDNFFKIGKVFHRHPNAKGFGLYMTKTQVEAMNGKIWVESTPDVGSTFYVEFINQEG